jgi:uncharacterized protein DUF5681
MSSEGDDDQTGYGRPPKQTQWKPGQPGNPERRYPKRAESTVELIDKFLLKPVEITVGEKSRRVTTLEAILFRLFQKEVLGDARALKIRLKYEEFARQYLRPRYETVFVDNEYTKAFAAVPQTKGTDDE